MPVTMCPPAPAPADHNARANLVALTTAWYNAKQALAAAQAAEGAARRELAAFAFPDAPEKGTARTGLGDGKDLKLTAKLNYTVAREALAEVQAKAADPASGDPALVEVLSRVLRYKPEVVEAELQRVTDPAVKMALASFITSKPGMPGLEVVDSKKGA